MSSKFYTNMWLATSKDLKDVILYEKALQQLQPEMDRIRVHGIFGNLYARYVILYNNLIEVYDQTRQVQKKMAIGKILVAVNKRLKDIQRELTSNIELSEFIYMDDVIVEMKYVPDDVQIVHPYYTPFERPPDIQAIVDDDRFAMENQEIPMTILEAAHLIKIHEKARQARLRLGYIRSNPEKYRPRPRTPDPGIIYNFYHKPDQRWFKPVKKTVYRDNFYRTDLKKSENFTFYQPKSKGGPTINSSNLFDEIIIKTSDDGTISDQDEMDKIAVDQNIIIQKCKEDAATVIQHAYHRYRLRKLIKKRKLKRLVQLGMLKLHTHKKKQTEINVDFMKSRRSRQKEFNENFQKVCDDTKARILKIRSPWIMEDISDDIRCWFREWYDRAGVLDKYPDVLKGGTILVMRGKTKTIEEHLEIERKHAEDLLLSAEKKKAEKEKAALKKETEKEKKMKAKDMEKKKQAQKKLMELKQGKTWEFNEPEFITKNFMNLEKEMIEYDQEWCFINHLDHLDEKPLIDWITLDKYAEVNQELRVIVDEFMRVEFELLRKALAVDKKKKYKPQKPPRKRKAKKKKRIPADRTGSISIQDLFAELKTHGVIRRYEKRNLDEFIGDQSYAAFELRHFYDQDPIHFAGDLKQIIKSSIMGMGEVNLSKTNAMLIGGPPGSGKKMLVEAIATTSEAVIFDLSPKIVNTFPDLKYFLHLIPKMAKLFQPTILFIDQAHKTFYKKVPPNEVADNPKKLGKILKKLMKAFKDVDRVMLIGTTNDPLKGNPKKMRQNFKTTLLVPADYSSNFIAWHRFCLAKPGFIPTLDFSALAMVSKKYSIGRLNETVDNVVDLRRRMLFSRKALTVDELLEGLLSGTPYIFPPTEPAEQKMLKWYRTVNPLAGKRQKELKKKEESQKKKK